MRYSAFAWLIAVLAPVAPAAAQGNPDSAQAAERYRQACENGNADGCVNLGIVYAHGLGVPADPARAAQLYSRAAQLYAPACDGGNAHACNNLATLVIDGRGVPRDAARAVRLYARACQLDRTINANCDPAPPAGH
jgi:TPR repeat protein